jgi:acyl-CoA thioesterase FadM
VSKVAKHPIRRLRMTEEIGTTDTVAPGPSAAYALHTGGRTVPGEWIDYNGHMMDAYYSLAFTEATEALLDHLGLGASYREQADCGIYTVESHVCFRASARDGEQLRYDSQLLAYDAIRLHVFHRITLPSGSEAATNELMFLHVNLVTERVTPMPPEQFRAVGALASAHAALPMPELSGRRIAMRPRT